MKKTILASAIAAATFSGAAVAGAHESKNLPTVYGNIQYVLTHENIDGAGSAIDHRDNGSTIGFKHDHEIAPGVTGFFKAEFEFDADDKAGNGGLDSFDEAYIGVKGEEFGQVWIGSDDSMYETAIDEIFNHWEVGSGIVGNYDTGEGDLIQYLSPSFNGLTLGAALQVNGENKYDNAGKSYPFQLAAMYEVDNLELAFAIDSNDGYSKYSSTDEAPNNENTYGLRASYNLDDLRLTGSVETRKDVGETYGVMGVYAMGANQFALGYQMFDADNGDKNSTVSLQALHNLSDHMYVYVEGYFRNADSDIYRVGDSATTDGSGEGDEQTVAAIGAVYHF